MFGGQETDENICRDDITEGRERCSHSLSYRMMKMREFSGTSKSATQDPDIGGTLLNRGVISILRVVKGMGGDGLTVEKSINWKERRKEEIADFD